MKSHLAALGNDHTIGIIYWFVASIQRACLQFQHRGALKDNLIVMIVLNQSSIVDVQHCSSTCDLRTKLLISIHPHLLVPYIPLYRALTKVLFMSQNYM